MLSEGNTFDRLDRLELLISSFLRLTLLFAAVFAVFSARWSDLFTILLTLSLTFLPAIVGRSLRISLPTEFEFIFVIFVYAAFFLGEVHGYFTQIWWWDVFLHSLSSVNLGFVGFIILYVIYRAKRITASPILIVLFSFCFALAIGALWEIYEFAMDSIFGLNMQKSGLVDTMWDLVVDAGGAFVASLIGYFYIKLDRGPVIKRMLGKVLEKNPRLRKT
jgi:hypothetical protein